MLDKKNELGGVNGKTEKAKKMQKNEKKLASVLQKV